MPFWLIKFAPAIIGVFGVGAVVLGFNMWLDDRDKKQEQIQIIARQASQIKSINEKHKLEIANIEKDMEAREAEKQLEIDRLGMNDSAINAAKQDVKVKHIYVKGKCNSPGYVLW